ncbi:MAG: hypothetical protein ABSC51_05940 [Gaiellaceae bacterium]
MNLDSKSIIQKTIAHNVEAEQELLDVLRELIALSIDRPGGVAIDELARRLGRDQDRRSVRELLERGRSAIEDEVGSGGRFAVIERVYDDPFAYWRARYVPTSFGRVYLQGLDSANKKS